MSDQKNVQSYWLYLPIVLVLGFGYFAGGILTFGVYFLGLFESVANPTARLTIVLFGMGLIGATMYCTRWWALDMEEALKDKALLPHFFDSFGYLTNIIGGGITGVLLYLFFKAGVALTISAQGMTEIRLPAALVIAFCGGLFHFEVQKVLRNAFKNLFKKRGMDHENEGES